MMNWNQNDTKYILKRIILYFIIAGIVFFAGHSCAKATTINQISFPNTTIHLTSGTQNGVIQTGGIAANKSGYLVFSFVTMNDTGSYIYPVHAVEIFQHNLTTVCEIGTTIGYTDSSRQYIIYTAKCPINTDSTGIAYIGFMRPGGNGDMNITISDKGTITADENGANAIVGTITTATSQQVEAINSMKTTIVNSNTQTQQAITNAMNNAHADSQAVQNAINNQTQAINDQTDWFDQDYSSIIDTEFLDVFDDLFDNDDDVVRQFILIPLNFFVLIYNACSSNTCSPIELGELYGTTIIIPCINWSSLVGTGITNTIDIIFAACLVFGMIRMIKKMINKIMTLSSTITDECGVEVFK